MSADRDLKAALEKSYNLVGTNAMRQYKADPAGCWSTWVSIRT
jgi:hypothetical protein